MTSIRPSTPRARAPFEILVAVSSIHEPSTVSALVDAWLAPLAARGGQPREAAGAPAAGSPVVFVATGGTERQILDGARFEPREPALLVAHPGHNSLPAALEVLARLQQTGRRGRIVYLRAPDDAQGLATLDAALEDRAARRALLESRIGLVGDPSDWLVASRPASEIVRSVWGPTVVPLALEPLLAVPDDEAVARGAALARDFRARAEGPAGPADSDLNASGRVHALLARMVEAERLDAVAVRCFDLVTSRRTTGCMALAQLNDDGVVAGCEGDLVATVAMLWLHRLLGLTPWMANPSRLDPERGTLSLAHCTVPRSAAERYRLRSHFESGLGVGVQGALATGPVTLVRLGGARMECLLALDGTLERNTDHPDLCRTQVEVAVGREALEDLLAHPLGNHLVLVPGHHAARLRSWHRTMIA